MMPIVLAASDRVKRVLEKEYWGFLKKRKESTICDLANFFYANLQLQNQSASKIKPLAEFVRNFDEHNYFEAVIQITHASFEDIRKIASFYSQKPAAKDDIDKAKKLYGIIKRNKFSSVIQNLLRLNVCPYCGRNFINQKSGVALDHYFPISQYPLLAVSLYNLIPCCHSCNLSKHDIDDVESKLPSPYLLANQPLSNYSAPVHFIATLNSKMKVELVTEYRSAGYVEGYDKALSLTGNYNRDIYYVEDLLEKMRLLTSAYGDSQMAFISSLLAPNSYSCQPRNNVFLRLKHLLLGRNIGSGINNLYPYYVLDNDLYRQFISQLLP